ncbi:hypothetical protein P7H19_02515 [Paenibacillus larvae]|nr:hypothetical protein [Paenibacillus larvae]MDT2235462.1 hypothetical protein [Paenibacillus larvae]
MTDQDRNDKKKDGENQLVFTILCIVFIALKFTGLLEPVLDFLKNSTS